MRLELRPRAVADLADIRMYLLEHASEQAADRVRRHLLRRLETLQKNPRLGIASSREGIRILSPSKYPYRIYFTLTDKAVVVLHIRHTSRRLPDLRRL